MILSPPYYVSFLFSYHYGILPRYRLRLSLSGSILYYIRLTALFTWNGACVVTFLMIMMTNFAFLHDITFHILVLYYVYYIFSTYIYIVQFIPTTLMYFRRTVFLSVKKIPFFHFIFPLDQFYDLRRLFN